MKKSQRLAEGKAQLHAKIQKNGGDTEQGMARDRRWWKLKTAKL